MASTTVHATAEAALYEAASWYQDEDPNTALWLELFDEFEAVLELPRQHPESGRVYKGRVRRALLSRFPYAIYYVVEGDQVVVINFLAMRLERGSASAARDRDGDGPKNRNNSGGDRAGEGQGRGRGRGRTEKPK